MFNATRPTKSYVNWRKESFIFKWGKRHYIYIFYICDFIDLLVYIQIVFKGNAQYEKLTISV